jgi:hypothetical protein
VLWFILFIGWIVVFAQGVRISQITAKYPTMETVIVNTPTLTYPRICMRAFEPDARIILPLCNTKSKGVLPIATHSGADCPLPGGSPNCYCINNYQYQDVGTDKPLVAVWPDPDPIECVMNISKGDAFLWVCQPNSDGSCGNRFSNPWGQSSRPIGSGMRTFVGLIPSINHNNDQNRTMNSTDYTTILGQTPVVRSLLNNWDVQLHISFHTFRIFHHFARDELDSFRFLMVLTAYTFFSMCLHKLAFLCCASTFIRDTTLESGWGPSDGERT